MRRYEITCPCSNDTQYPYPVTALIIEPDEVNENTGVILCTHGWGNNRSWDETTLQYLTEFNLAAISVEYRGSGMDYSQSLRIGFVRPYDASFHQLTDVLNMLRHYLALRTNLNRSRLFHYGVSQGGHMALLSAIYAPHTFAAVFAACPLTFMEPKQEEWAGRIFHPHEASARSVIEHADRIQCPVFLSHGTADDVVRWESHTKVLTERLQQLGKQVATRYVEGGDHGYAPTTTRLAILKELAPTPLSTLTTTGPDDFARKSVISLRCQGKTLTIDWSRPPEDAAVLAWM